MNWLIVPDLDVLAELNTHHTDRQIQAVQGAQGNWLVGADLLTDCGPGQTWETYGEWLASLTPTDEQPAPQTPEPDNAE